MDDDQLPPATPVAAAVFILALILAATAPIVIESGLLV